MATVLIRFQSGVSLERRTHIAKSVGLGTQHLTRDDGFVYVGFSCKDSKAASIVKELKRNTEVDTAQIERGVTFLFADDGTPLFSSIVEVDKIRALRHRILRFGLPYEETLWHGDELEETMHFAVRSRNPSKGEIIACATVVLSTWKDSPAWRLRGMAVDERYRGDGVGKSLLTQIEQVLAQYEPDTIWCNARWNAVPFYEKCGWVTTSKEYLDPDTGIPHQQMMKAITRS